MKIGALALATAAAIAGVFAGYSFDGDEAAAVQPSTRVHTVTVTQTVTRTTVVRPSARPDARAGRRVFASMCSTCHSLKKGDWSEGNVNLTALRTSYWGTVDKVISGGIVMPSFRGRLSEREIRDVAAFVARETARRARTRR